MILMNSKAFKQNYLQYLILTVFFITVISPLTFSSLYSQPSYEGYSLIWSDEFDTDGLPNPSNWGYEEGYVRNDELQYYTVERLENARVENGYLIIEARRDNWNGNEYTSASLVSYGKREFQYGIFEMRGKIDVRSGSWPAFWTLGVTEEWPSNGEVDIMEYYAGNLHANVAWGTDTRWEANWDSERLAVGSDFSDDFHIWRMAWDENEIRLYVDDYLQNTTDLSTTINGSISNLENPFHQPAYMIVNQAIGSNGGDPSGTTFPIRYEVDYIRVYQLGPDTVPPEMVDVVGSAAGTVTVLFSEKIAEQSAENLSNYSVNSPDISLISAELQSDNKTVLIEALNLKVNDLFVINVSGIMDMADQPNTIAETEMEFSVGPESIKLEGTLIGKGDPWEGNEGIGYEMAVDGNTSTYSDVVNDPVYVGYDFGEDNFMIITGIRYYPRNEYSDRMKGKRVEISQDGINWDVIYTIPTVPAEDIFTKDYIAYSTPVRFVRYNGSGGYLNVSEIEFWGYDYSSTITDIYMDDIIRRYKKATLNYINEPVRVFIYTVSGRLVKSLTLDHEAINYGIINSVKRFIGYQSLSEGLYFLRIKDAGNRERIFKKVMQSR